MLHNRIICYTLILPLFALLLGCSRKADLKPEPDSSTPRVSSDSDDLPSVEALFRQAASEISGDERVFREAVLAIRQRGAESLPTLFKIYLENNRLDPIDSYSTEFENRQFALSVILMDYETVTTRWDSPTEAEVIEKLHRLLSDSSMWLRYQAASDLSHSPFQIPPAVRKKVIETTAKMLDSDELKQRRFALITVENEIAKWPADTAYLVPQLTRLTSDESTQYEAITCLGKLGSAAKSALPILENIQAKSSDPRIKKVCAEAVSRIQE